ncbi:MAG: DASS family sodium-coupled anion symporter [Negativicutes bacterium]|nr:DASS family sodium-coupled anion symporter [Negativicutes bacterium]
MPGVKQGKKKYWGFTSTQLAGLAAAVSIWLIMHYIVPVPKELSQPAWSAIAVMLMMLAIWLTDALSAGTSGFLVVVLLVLTKAGAWGKATSPSDLIGNALSGFAQAETWLIAAAFLLGIALVESGLGRRITYGIMSMEFIGKSFSRIILGFSLASGVLGPFVPSSTAKTGIFIPLAQGVLNTLGIKPYAETGKHSNNASALIINTAWMGNTAATAFATGSAGVVSGLGILSSVSKVSVPWIEYAYAMFLPSLVLVFGAWYLVIKMFPPEISEVPGGVVEAKKRYQELGPVTTTEKRVCAIFALTLLLWIFERQVALHTTFTAMLACFCLLAPGLGLGMKDKDILKKMSWDAIILFGASMSLAGAISKTGAADWLAKAIFGGIQMQGWPPVMIAGFFVVFMFITHLGFASGTAHKMTFMPIILAFCGPLGINPVWIGIPLVAASSNAFMLHTITPSNVIAFGTGHFPLSDMIKSGAIMTVFASIVLTLFAAYWFPLVGIPVYK